MSHDQNVETILNKPPKIPEYPRALWHEVAQPKCPIVSRHVRVLFGRRAWPKTITEALDAEQFAKLRKSRRTTKSVR